MRLTPSAIDRLPLGIHRDHVERGLFVEVGKQHASFKIQGSLYTSEGRKDIRRTLGRTTDMTLDQARDMARPMLRAIRDGKHPDAATPGRAITVGYLLELNERRMEADRCSTRHIAEVYSGHLCRVCGQALHHRGSRRAWLHP